MVQLLPMFSNGIAAINPPGTHHEIQVSKQRAATPVAVKSSTTVHEQLSPRDWSVYTFDVSAYDAAEFYDRTA